MDKLYYINIECPLYSVSRITDETMLSKALEHIKQTYPDYKVQIYKAYMDDEDFTFHKGKQVFPSRLKCLR